MVVSVYPYACMRACMPMSMFMFMFMWTSTLHPCVHPCDHPSTHAPARPRARQEDSDEWPGDDSLQDPDTVVDAVEVPLLEVSDDDAAEDAQYWQPDSAPAAPPPPKALFDGFGPIVRPPPAVWREDMVPHNAHSCMSHFMYQRSMTCAWILRLGPVTIPSVQHVLDLQVTAS